MKTLPSGNIVLNEDEFNTMVAEFFQRRSADNFKEYNA